MHFEGGLTAVLEAAREAERGGDWTTALRLYELALQRLPEGGSAADAAGILRRIGAIHRERGDLDLAREVYEVSLHIAEACDLPEHVASGLVSLAMHEQQTGGLEVAEELYARARGIAQQLAHVRLLAMIDQNMGALANVRGDVDKALRCYGSALAIYRELGDDLASAGLLTNIGMAHVDLEQWGLAFSRFDEAFDLAARSGDVALLGTVEINRVELYLKSGHSEQARESCDRAYEIFGRMGSESGLAEADKFYGVLHRERGKSVLADRHFSSAVELARKCQDRLLEAEALSEWALVHLVEERNREALQCLNEAHHLFSELSARRELLDLDARLDSLESTYLRVVQAWGESIESKDLYTAGHCERVANYACMLAEAVGITGRDLTWLRMGGYLHDVGKISVPAEVLNKPGRLTDEEFKLIQSHAAEGDAIVAELNFPWDIRPAVRWHHERWDGSGYPDGLKGEEIPLTARILCVADVYDALTTTRSYRPAMSREQALEIMERDVGRFFDPALFARFRSLITGAGPGRDGRFPAFGSLRSAAVA